MESSRDRGMLVVPMRLYANWEVDRASSSSIQRVLSMVINKLVLFKSLKSESNIVIAVRLQSNKRTLRSNDIALPIVNSDRLDLMLDISFTIQYSHIIKRKSNIVQLLIQRRKKYKNRQIPGFKTLAIGYLNLDEVLQQGGHREVVMWDTSMIKKTDDLTELRGGVIYISNCQTQAVDAEQDLKWNKGTGTKEGGTLLSEEEIDDDSSQEESDYDANEQNEFDRTPRLAESSKGRLRTRKKINQKNIKQKIASLLRRFKLPDEDNAVLTGDSSSRVLHPTAKELEEIFEELENSDSGPELEPDKMSIVSNPRPGLRPYFGGSKTDILPPIDDQCIPSDESSDEQELSSENENQHEEIPYYLSRSLAPDFLSSDMASLGNGDTAPETSRSQKSRGEFHRLSGKDRKKVKEGSPERMRSSTTFGSISATEPKTSLPSHSPSVVFASGRKEAPTSHLSTTFVDNMLTQLDDSKSFIAQNVWICSSSDLPWIAKTDSSQLRTLRLIDCSSSLDVRTAMQTIVGRIQKFCNSNSVSPPQTLIGVLGTDRLVAHLLRAYVDLLQNKSSQDWLNYLRFALVVPPNSVVGRLLSQVGDGAQLETSWRSLSKLVSEIGKDGSKFSVNEITGIEECLSAITSLASQKKQVDLPIGEVMLQLTSHEALLASGEEKEGSQAFVPFLSEIHLGNLDELNSLYYMKNSTEEAAEQTSSAGAAFSPPASPSVNKAHEYKELQIEYWTTTMATTSYPHMGTYEYPSGSNSMSYHPKQQISESTKPAVGGGKFSLKATVRTLSIAREPMSTSLSMLFVKERKKDKVLQKLGRKTKPRGTDSFYSQSRVVSSVTRMICIGKNSELEISIDGYTWKRISFFQITSQWQTHVKYFPISIALNKN